MSKSVISEHSHKRGAYPFITQDKNGKDTLITSNAHRKLFMKENGLHDDIRGSLKDSKRRKKNYDEEKRKEKKALLTETFMKAKHGNIDLRPMDLERKKREYLIRNGYIKGGWYAV